LPIKIRGVITRIATIIRVIKVERELLLFPPEKTLETALCRGRNIIEKTNAKSKEVRYGKNIKTVRIITPTSITRKK